MCEGDGNAGVGSGGGVVEMSVCMGGTRGSGVLSSTGDVLEMSVVRGGHKQFELLEIVFDSVYVDLQYDEISLTFTAG